MSQTTIFSFLLVLFDSDSACCRLSHRMPQRRSTLWILSARLIGPCRHSTNNDSRCGISRSGSALESDLGHAYYRVTEF